MTTSLAARPYNEKHASYFGGARQDWIEELPENPSAVLLDIGCGEGATGALARRWGKCGAAYGVELTSDAGSVAASVLDEVLIGDAEDLEYPWAPASIDILILSEVIEHLREPWSLLRRIRPLLRPGAKIFASSPNVAHHRIVRALLVGRWSLSDYGPMDRTHLRWFTPSSYRELFDACGYAVDRVGPLGPLGPRSRVLDFITFGRMTHLLHAQIELHAHITGEDVRSTSGRDRPEPEPMASEPRKRASQAQHAPETQIVM
jgi:SAM-dependent methyltransferase